jgi:hypothetical protein
VVWLVALAYATQLVTGVRGVSAIERKELARDWSPTPWTMVFRTMTVVVELEGEVGTPEET